MHAGRKWASKFLSFLACVFTVLESPVLVSLKFVSSQLFRDAG